MILGETERSLSYLARKVRALRDPDARAVAGLFGRRMVAEILGDLESLRTTLAADFSYREFPRATDSSIGGVEDVVGRVKKMHERGSLAWVDWEHVVVDPQGVGFSGVLRVARRPGMAHRDRRPVLDVRYCVAGFVEVVGGVMVRESVVTAETHRADTQMANVGLGEMRRLERWLGRFDPAR